MLAMALLAAGWLYWFATRPIEYVGPVEVVVRPGSGLAVVAGCGAAFMYGIGVHLLRRYFTGMPQAALAAATLGTSALLTLPFAVAEWPEAPVSAQAWWSAALLGVLCTGLAYAVYYRLVQRIGASRAVTVTYLVPLFAVGWAWWLLDEPLTVSMGIAGLLILGSVAITQKTKA